VAALIQYNAAPYAYATFNAAAAAAAAAVTFTTAAVVVCYHLRSLIVEHERYYCDITHLHCWSCLAAAAVTTASISDNLGKYQQ
jgi:hypothetical protein